MKKILETPRLYLRELCTDDARHFTDHVRQHGCCTRT